MSALTLTQQKAVEAAYEAFGPARLRFCPHTPAPKQEAFLLLWQLEALYGGAAGGGKSVALLMAALQYCDVPGYAALLLRPSRPEFSLPGGLIELSHQWLASSKASWSGELHRWRFPGPGKAGAGGAILDFGYLNDPNDANRYAGSSYSFLGFDELVRFSEQQYRLMFRALRQPAPATAAALPAARDGTTLAQVPVRVRATSNPGDSGHAWVKSHFVDPATREPGALFLPSQISDNPYLDRDNYLRSLAHLPGATRERLLHGDWEIPDDGELFQRAWLQIIERHQLPAGLEAVRYWDLAASEPSPTNPDPDYTVGLRLEHNEQEGSFYITDLIRVRKAPGAIERLVATTAQTDGRDVHIYIEEQPGAAGKMLTHRYTRHVLKGYSVRADRPSGAKDVRAQPVAAAAQNGVLKLLPLRNRNDLLDELAAFPNGAHDDCVDALAGAYNALNGRGRTRIKKVVSPARIRIDDSGFPDHLPHHPLARRHWRPEPTLEEEAFAASIGVSIYQGGW
jgi:predicted phage terminase large subunit-like protein